MCLQDRTDQEHEIDGPMYGQHKVPSVIRLNELVRENIPQSVVQFLVRNEKSEISLFCRLCEQPSADLGLRKTASIEHESIRLVRIEQKHRLCYLKTIDLPQCENVVSAD